jgi:anti-anti-sigma factor
MKLTYEDYDQLTVLTCKGEFAGDDACSGFRTLVKDRLEQRTRDMVVDLSTVESIDSRGLETLLWLQDLCAEKLGQVRLAGCTETISQILEITRLAGRFDRHDTIDEAIRSLR